MLISKDRKTTFISQFFFLNKRIKSSDLYAAIPPPIIKIIFFLLKNLSIRFLLEYYENQNYKN